jgi:hypothetical protein
MWLRVAPSPGVMPSLPAVKGTAGCSGGQARADDFAEGPPAPCRGLILSQSGDRAGAVDPLAAGP